MENVSGIHPTNDFVLVAPRDVELRSPGGIVLAASTLEREEMAQINGIVIEATDIALKHAALKGVALGDNVVHAKFAGIRYKGQDGVWYRLMRVNDIIAKVDKITDNSLKGRDSLGTIMQEFDNEPAKV